jgi:hypothetical protein
VTTLELSWLGLGEGAAKEKIVCIKSNPFSDAEVQNWFQATTLFFAPSHSFFFSNYISILAT